MGNVDQNGYLIPVTAQNMLLTGKLLPGEEPQVLRQRLSCQFNGYAGTGGGRYYLLAQGVMDKLLLDGMNNAISESFSTLEPDPPPIPAWLGEHLPFQTVFLPNGDVLCYGELGLHYEPSDDPANFLQEDWPEGHHWYRYSNDGELLAELFPWSAGERTSWQKWFYGNDDEARGGPAISGGAAGPMFYRRHDDEPSIQRSTTYWRGLKVEMTTTAQELYGGWSAMPGSYEFESAVDWLGNEVPFDEVYGPMPVCYLMDWDRDALSAAYLKQLAMEITRPDIQSPYAGLPNGPRMVDPTPRKRQLLASRWTQDGEQQITVQPLGAEDNPYRDQYQAWDYWVFEQIGKRNPGRDQRFQEMMQQRQEALIEAQASGSSQDLQLAGRRTIWIDFAPNDPWREFRLEVDEQGFVLPLLAPDENSEVPEFWVPKNYYETREKFSSKAPSGFTILAGGVMEPELEKEFLWHTYGSCAWDYPEISDWIAENPVERLALLPDGTMIANTEPGKFLEPTFLVLEPEEALQPDTAYRYSPDGELLARLNMRLSFDYLPLTFPEYEAFKTEKEATGFMLDWSMPGYLLVTKRADEDGNTPPGSPGGTKVVEAYTFDGKPLELDQPAKYLGFPSQRLTPWLSWQEICDVYSVQQLVPKSATYDNL